MTFADFHCDTITKIINKNEKLYSNSGDVDIRRLVRYESPVQTFALCFDGSGSFSEALAAINFLNQELQENCNFIKLAKNLGDIVENKRNNLISALIAIEGGEVLEGDLQNVDKFYNMGVRIFTLTWNFQNLLGYGALSENIGMTDFGKAVVNKLNELGIIVDVSHLSEKGFWDVAACSNTPFIASHSNCAAICNNPRNLTDEQIRVIAKRNSVIGVNLYPLFLNDSGAADINDIIRHIKHLVNVGGIDCVALGSDFDGVKYLPAGIDGVSSHEKLYAAISSEYGCKPTEKIMGGNMLRVVKEIIG